MIKFDLALAHGRAVAIDVIDPDDAVLAELHPDERTRALTLSPIRRREWVAGRRALRHALAGVAPGAAAAPVLADDRGAPVLGAGAVGSISHKRALAVALAAGADGWTVGVDLEVLGPRRVDISERILTKAELSTLASTVPSTPTGDLRDRAVLLAFALKEAVYKAIDPHLRRYVGFQEVQVWPSADGTARIEPLTDWGGLALEATWLELDGNLLCTARARK
ncbi:MAG TPA: 4'-phosphopantetheinyl transferase superfamily protein, partial [Kofleriaceae bacterium]|nr:4'-phosphopantetheinyl transferase superfamily protein [Kofleriaceae bacterium]